MKIYTKTGDDGTTALIGGTRVPKHHIKIEAYGTVDELNAHIGLLRDHVQDELIKKDLLYVQDKLFVIGAHLATDTSKNTKFKLPVFKKESIAFLEEAIDALDKNLPVLQHFILPGGHPVVSVCHVARCVCRRAERNVNHLKEIEDTNPAILIFLNRLSDYLFTLARKLSKDLQAEEIEWLPSKD